MRAAALAGGPDVLKPLRRGGDGVHIILDAHDDDSRLAAAADDEALVFLGGPFDDLAEPRPGSQGRNDVGRGFLGWNGFLPELID
jgi:hypothetical protein